MSRFEDEIKKLIRNRNGINAVAPNEQSKFFGAGYVAGLQKALEMYQTEINVYDKVEAEPIRHGRWIFIDETMMTVSRFECSVCKTYQLDPHTPSIMRYCPNCGAKMDGKENEQ